jgi:hypothetical protein
LLGRIRGWSHRRTTGMDRLRCFAQLLFLIQLVMRHLVVKMLCSNGWKIAACMLPDIGRGLCILAAHNGNLQVLDWLLENGFDHDIIKYKGRSHGRF